MHISEGVLNAPVLITGAGLALAGTAIGLKQMDYDRVAHVGVLSAAFFVTSLIHFNIGPASTHLILNGLLGLVLGWTAFPAILVALILQAVFFQFGGLTTLGVNTLIMALPAVACYYGFRNMLQKTNDRMMLAAFGCGSISVMGSALLLGASLVLADENFWAVSSIIIAANIPVMIIEGIVTAFCIVFIKKASPEILNPSIL
jgi:cobalt/nickel transport system permease protein